MLTIHPYAAAMESALEKPVSTTHLEDDVYRALVDTLYTSPTSLFMGALVGSLTTGCVAYYAGNYYLWVCFYAITLVGTMRTVSYILYKKNIKVGSISPKSWEKIYEIGAWLFALIIGVMSFFTIILSSNFRLHVIAATLSCGYTGAIAGRNAGRPNIAYGQVILAAAPLAISFLLKLDVINGVLGISVIGGILASIVITKQTHTGVMMAFVEKHQNIALAGRFQDLANSDPLTGLGNRLMFTKNLKEALDPALSTDSRMIAIFWIDLDHFKQINDTMGHSTGDKVLYEIASRLQQVVGKSGSAARFGGDEFVLIMRVHDNFEATVIAQNIVNLLALPYSDQLVNIDISGSVGVALTPVGELNDAGLMQNADIALYQAKISGRQGYAIFDDMMAEQLHKEREMQTDLRRALANGQFEIYYQPIVDIKTAEPVAYEALLRWHHPIYGMISPAIFIPIAESVKQIEAITQWVLDGACREASTWPEHVRLNVNISPSLLKTRQLVRIIHNALINSKISPKRLCLELTENVFIDDNVNSLIMLKEFRKMGISLALDDFGTGYSSLSYVCKYNFNSLKIDKSFVTNMKRSSESRAVIDAIVGLGTSLDITIVGEGVETESDRQYLEDAGCRYAQGYLFGRPEPIDRIYHRNDNIEIRPIMPTPLRLVRAAHSKRA